MQLVEDFRLSRSPATAFVVVGMYWGSFAALAPQLKSRTGLSDAEFGMALLFGAIGALMAMWLAPRADAALRQRALPILAVALAAAFLLPGLATGGWFFAIAMLAASAGSGTLDVVMNARVSQIESRESRSLMNLNHAVFSFAYAAAAQGAGLMRGAGAEPAAVFATCGAITLILLVPMTRGQPRSGPGRPVPRVTGISPALLGLAGAIVLIAFMAEQATEGWSALHLERNLGADAVAGALGPAILGLTMGIGRLSGQLVARRLSEGAVMRIAAAVAAAGAVVAAWSQTLALAYLGFAILGFGVSVLAPMAFAWVGRHVSDHQRVTAISRVAVIGYAGFFLGPPMMGFLAQFFGLQTSFSAVAACLLIVTLVLVPALRATTRS